MLKKQFWYKYIKIDVKNRILIWHKSEQNTLPIQFQGTFENLIHCYPVNHRLHIDRVPYFP